MIEEKQNEIIDKINNSEEIKRFKELEKIIKNNEEYKKIQEEFKKENLSNKEKIELRKRLFDIKEVKEYSSLESKIRLFSKETSNIISSIVENNKC